MSYGITYDPSKDRIIYGLIADGQIVKCYADIDFANEQYEKLRRLKPQSKVSPPIPIKLADNQTIDSRGFNRVRTSEF